MTEGMAYGSREPGYSTTYEDEYAALREQDDLTAETLLNTALLRRQRLEQIAADPHTTFTPLDTNHTPVRVNELIQAALAFTRLDSSQLSGEERGRQHAILHQYTGRPDSQYEGEKPMVIEPLTRESAQRKAKELIGSIDTLVQRFYEGTEEVHRLGNMPTVMFKPRDENLNTALELIARLKAEKWIVFYTDGTVVSIPPSHQSLMKTIGYAWKESYIGVGLPKGFNQGTAEPDSSGLIRSVDPTGKDKRVYSDIGFSAAIAARRGLSRDMALRKEHQGNRKPVFFGYSMADDKLEVPHSDPSQPVIKRKKHYYVGKFIGSDDMQAAFEGVTEAYFEHVRQRVDYPLTMDKLQWRDISNFAECIVDTIDSTDDVYMKPVSETQYRLRVTMALFRSFQTIVEEYWNYIYRDAYRARHPDPKGRKNPIAYQIYGESIKLQFEDIPEAKVENIPAVRYLNEFIERSVQKMDYMLNAYFRKRLQPSLLRHPDYGYRFNGSDSTDHSFNGLMAKLDEFVEAYRAQGHVIDMKWYSSLLKDVLRRTTFMYNGYIQSSPHIDDKYEAEAAQICKEIIALYANSDVAHEVREEDKGFSHDVYLITDDYMRLFCRSEPKKTKHARKIV